MASQNPRILKVSLLTNCLETILIGKNISMDKWEKLFTDNNKNWIMQEYCDIPSTIILENKNGQIEEIEKKYAGIVSRISESDIINVESGGYGQPVRLVDNGN